MEWLQNRNCPASGSRAPRHRTWPGEYAVRWRGARDPATPAHSAAAGSVDNPHSRRRIAEQPCRTRARMSADEDVLDDAPTEAVAYRNSATSSARLQQRQIV